MATYPEFKSPLTHVWQYLNRNLPYFRKVLGIIQDPVTTTGFDTDCTSTCNQVKNCTLTIDGTPYDVYKLQGIAIMEDPSNIYVRLLGSITTSSTTLIVTKNSTNVKAFDTTFQDTHTAISTGSLVQDADPLSPTFEEVVPVQLMFVNTDNTWTTPDEYFFYAIGADASSFNCRVNVDLEIAVERGSTVTYSTL
jgi:hypothetical protein